MRRLLAAVILVDETGHGIEIMGVHGHGQPLNHLGHQILPRLMNYRAGGSRHGLNDGPG